MKHLIITTLILLFPVYASAKGITVHAVDRDAMDVFRTAVEQDGKNYVMAAGLLDGLKVTVDANNASLKSVLKEMFANTEIEFKINGNSVILKRKRKKIKSPTINPVLHETILPEVTVVSRLDKSSLSTPEIGAQKVTSDYVRKQPALLGEPDIIKALQSQPGISAGTDGLAGLHVHGGEADENLYMLDNVPVYQVNHFCGLFSAFNNDIIRYADFFTSSIPARYDGRLSSVLDVRTLSGTNENHHGIARLGLTSGSFSIEGPIGNATSYSAAVRRSWYDVLTVPTLTIINASQSQEKIKFRYAFMDFNGKITHRFSPRSTASLSIYFGDDYLMAGSDDYAEGSYSSHDSYTLHWGNLMVRAGLNYRLTDNLQGEFTSAFTRFFSDGRINERMEEFYHSDDTVHYSTHGRTDNDITDWILRADFIQQGTGTLRFGAGYTRHDYLPGRLEITHTFKDLSTLRRDSVSNIGANEADAYVEYDLSISHCIMANAGFHGTIYNIDGHTFWGYAPRLSIGYTPWSGWAFKAAYTRTNQYVHLLSESYLSLPSDRWLPTLAGFKPQTADKIAAGATWQSNNGAITISLEGYYKKLRHLVEYRDEYYVIPPVGGVESRLTSGSGTAKGVDMKLEYKGNRLAGQISYSLAWADRTFAEKNMGKTYPARFDNRHTINITASCKISDRVELNALWTGHSGNRCTLLYGEWEGPDFGYMYHNDTAPLRAPLNNYRLPFYHRLDLSLNVSNRHGYWTFGLYNAYCHMNTVGIRRTWRNTVILLPEHAVLETRPVFQKVKLIPIIPSISYTWIF